MPLALDADLSSVMRNSKNCYTKSDDNFLGQLSINGTFKKNVETFYKTISNNLRKVEYKIPITNLHAISLFIEINLPSSLGKNSRLQLLA